MAKQVLKTLALRLLSRFIPLRDEIFLESKPIFSDNTYRLYLEMLEQGLNERYRLSWIYDDYDVSYGSPLPEALPANVRIVRFDRGIRLGKLRRICYLARGRLYISCNYFYGGRRKGQFNLHLNHGAPFKNAGEYNCRSPLCSAETALSQFLVPYTAVDSGIPEEKLVVTGFPRNDYFFPAQPMDREVIPALAGFGKVVAWLPTFRQSWDKVRVDSDVVFPYGIPIIQSREDMIALNDAMRETNTLLIIKIHFAQDMTYIVRDNFSHIRFYTNRDLDELQLQLNEFLAMTDALITDYSSVYFDYLLAGKPIGLTIDDLEHYLAAPGIRYENYFEAIRGCYLSDLSQMLDFLSRTVQTGDDSALAGARERYHDYTDGGSSRRVLDYLRREGVIF